MARNYLGKTVEYKPSDQESKGIGTRGVVIKMEGRVCTVKLESGATTEVDAKNLVVVDTLSGKPGPQSVSSLFRF